MDTMKENKKEAPGAGSGGADLHSGARGMMTIK